MCNSLLLIESIRFLCQQQQSCTFSHMGKVRADLSSASHPALALFSMACLGFCLEACCMCFVCFYLSGHAERHSKREKHHRFTANAHFSIEQLPLRTKPQRKQSDFNRRFDVQHIDCQKLLRKQYSETCGGTTLRLQEKDLFIPLACESIKASFEYRTTGLIRKLGLYLFI